MNRTSSCNQPCFMSPEKSAQVKEILCPNPAVRKFTQSLMHHLCKHIRCSVPSSENSNLPLLHLMNTILDQLQPGQNCSTATRQCSQCYMNYMMDAMDFKEDVPFLIRRTSLGAGLTRLTRMAKPYRHGDGWWNDLSITRHWQYLRGLWGSRRAITGRTNRREHFEVVFDP